MAHVATWVIAGLRSETFTSMAALQARVRERVDAYNAEPFQKREGSRRSVFLAEERPLLGVLPAAPFEISQWVYGRKVGRNGHVVWAKNYYSVPFAHIGAKVDLRLTQTMIEIYRGDERLSSHLVLPATARNKYCTNDADLPEGRGWQPWDRTRIEAWADRVGPATRAVTDRVFESVQIEEQAHDPALAILRLTKRFSPARVEAACQLALRGPVRNIRYAHLRPILDTGQDKSGQIVETAAEVGGYVRGSHYYAGQTR